MNSKIIVLLSIVLWGICVPQNVNAADAYPVKPIRVVIPYAAGGSGDIVARLLAIKLTEIWNQQLVIDNRAGANGMLGTDLVARAQPDGYTILLATDIQFAISPVMYPKISYDAERDFTPLSLAVFNQYVLAVPPSLGVKTLQEFIALAKSKPGRLNFGSAGNGSMHQLTMELLKLRAGIDVQHVPYKGTPQAFPDLISNQINVMYSGISQTLPYLQSGQLLALAVGSTERIAALPGIPTLAETFPGFQADAWWGFFAPAGTPVAITIKLGNDIGAAVKFPEIRDRLVEQVMRPVGSTPQELAAQVRADRIKWAKVIADAHIRLE